MSGLIVQVRTNIMMTNKEQGSNAICYFCQGIIIFSRKVDCILLSVVLLLVWFESWLLADRIVDAAEGSRYGTINGMANQS